MKNNSFILLQNLCKQTHTITTHTGTGILVSLMCWEFIAEITPAHGWSCEGPDHWEQGWFCQCYCFGTSQKAWHSSDVITCKCSLSPLEKCYIFCVCASVCTRAQVYVCVLPDGKDVHGLGAVQSVVRGSGRSWCHVAVWLSVFTLTVRLPVVQLVGSLSLSLHTVGGVKTLERRVHVIYQSLQIHVILWDRERNTQS